MNTLCLYAYYIFNYIEHLIDCEKKCKKID